MLTESLGFSESTEQSLITTPTEHGKLTVSLARDKNEVAEAQHLRYKVFAEEMGANIQSKNALDQDGFDVFCDHLIIRESNTNKVVGTYRILNPKWLMKQVDITLLANLILAAYNRYLIVPLKLVAHASIPIIGTEALLPCYGLALLNICRLTTTNI